MYVWRNIEARLQIIAVEKQLVLYVFVCVCALAGLGMCMRVRVVLLIQRAMRMRHTLTSFVAPLPPPHFSSLSLKRHGFRKKVIEHKMCVFVFRITFVWNIYHYEDNLARYCYKMWKLLRVKYPLFLSDFNETWSFSTDFRKSLKYLQNPSSVNRVFRCGQTDRRIDVTKVNCRFSQFFERA
jgi:hypothetical protein